MLLLVFETENDSAKSFIFGCLPKKTSDGGVDMTSVGEDLIERRPGERGAKLLFRHLAEGLVVAVEEPAEVWVIAFVSGDELGEDKRFKEPRSMREVPLDGRSFRAGLHHQVFRREGSGEVHGGLTDLLEALQQGGSDGVLGQHGRGSGVAGTTVGA